MASGENLAAQSAREPGRVLRDDVAVTFQTQLDFANYGKLALGLVLGRAIAGRSRGYLERILATPVVFSLVLIALSQSVWQTWRACLCTSP